ncbi:MAG TPA: class I SAM-dependent rRNA methyltransferase [Candidatus Acetatifactor stercoripullorum]|uniref:Class I SAM-dependent rRNA methyltransferase n=1 Tax=Candidatus Acetatifactor stercoripullorum TaxID=2838414 RepID=A0A9D1R3S6_9FIRM|nr:class I SAM-dependent rRNA methyltransferase [uncultured Acetatifactor sp.]HIW81156.1 class I SAM-dependent rRNA methyltransferase [Candidatus Acetatifactor stercoripullorum]
MNQTIVTLKKGQGRTLKAGGMWVYDNEIDTILGSFENGDVVAVHDFDGFFLGWGFLNTKSKIAVRLLSRKKEAVIDEAFMEKRVRNAWEYRKQTIDTGSCRLIFGEADFLPGIVVDKFSDVLVVESLALGIDRWKPVIVEALKRVLAEDGICIRGVYERSDAKVRLQEGMERYKGFIGEPFDTKVEICENGVKYIVDVEEGQKTGFFLDQKNNRAAIQRLSRGKKVLDCFTHTGSFALNAGIAGAESVLGVDASLLAVEQARENARLNHLEDKVQFVCADVFELLPKLEEQGERFDVVILDPPAFTKSRNSVKNAVKGYREINLRGLKLVRDGGFLATCSCSHFMEPELFAKTIKEAAAGARKRLRQVEFRTQACDHPILWAADQSYYLKFYIFQVVNEG